MPFALVAIGLIMIITGAQNTYAAMATQLASDAAGFVKWVIAIGSVGALGYIPDLRAFSHYFMALILIVIVLANKGFFANFTDAINSGPIRPQPAPEAPVGGSSVPPEATQQAKDEAAGKTSHSFWDFLNAINPLGTTPAY